MARMTLGGLGPRRTPGERARKKAIRDRSADDSAPSAGCGCSSRYCDSRSANGRSDEGGAGRGRRWARRLRRKLRTRTHSQPTATETSPTIQAPTTTNRSLLEFVWSASQICSLVACTTTITRIFAARIRTHSNSRSPRRRAQPSNLDVAAGQWGVGLASDLVIADACQKTVPFIRAGSARRARWCAARSRPTHRRNLARL